MNKPKAPKDMTAPELVAEIKKRYSSGKYCGLSTINMTQLDEMMNEPAPNPFTPDQLAWMREEQRSEMKYAAKDSDGIVSVYTGKPVKFINNIDDDGEPRPCWDMPESEYWEGGATEDVSHVSFLWTVLSWDDPEPLCFADYAPMEGAADV